MWGWFPNAPLSHKISATLFVSPRSWHASRPDASFQIEVIQHGRVRHKIVRRHVEELCSNRPQSFRLGEIAYRSQEPESPIRRANFIRTSREPNDTSITRRVSGRGHRWGHTAATEDFERVEAARTCTSHTDEIYHFVLH